MQLTLTVLDGGMLRQTDILIYHKIFRKGSSFSIELSFQADEIAQFLLHEVAVKNGHCAENQGVKRRPGIAQSSPNDGRRNVTLL